MSNRFFYRFSVDSLTAGESFNKLFTVSAIFNVI